MSRVILLDHQATTPILPEVFETMRPFFAEAFGNPSSFHQHGLRARDALAKAREQMAALIHAESPEEIIFTSGGTEATNLAVKGAAWAGQRRGKHIVLSEIEHPAVTQAVEFLQGHGFTATRVKVDAAGRIDPAAVQAALTDQTILVALHLVNHEIGTIQPLQQIGGIIAERGIPFFVDATFATGWLPVDARTLQASLLSLSAHRFHGPKGCGVLYRHRRARLTPLLHGGEQEGGLRAGVENVPAIVGAGQAAEIAQRELAGRMAAIAGLQQRLWDNIECSVPYVQLNGPAVGPERVFTNLNVSVEFAEGEAVVLAADMAGMALASGSSCLGKSVKISPVLAALGLDPALAAGSILATLGCDNTADEMDRAAESLARIVARLRGMSPMWDDFESGRMDSLISPRVVS
ncbi:MAG TPA: cysteine desulfurase family protein [Verrucomicrobiae bacterium]|nr:cysteine desulfurase family protein [Verrucomicrobiae bacterium]